MPNRLSQETSPYLLQHKDNPVDWHPWGEEALARAKQEDKPLLVSVGYSACHWCHVMERESFEDPQTAELMNERFVCIKVDREERPDVDAILMDACQAMTGHGGWPLNAFLTPDQIPFYVGTYFPPRDTQGMPAWRSVLLGVAETYAQRRDEIEQQNPRVLAQLSASTRIEPEDTSVTQDQLDQAVAGLASSFDARNGGWGRAPKFPQSSVLEFLLARGEARMTTETLRKMATGGIYDQVGGGFSRYAVDATWTVPHFEKMLYDNALLARVYLHGWQQTGEELFRDTCSETLEWMLRELRGPEGGFCSALDADSEGVEGKFYVWTLDELTRTLGPELSGPAVEYFGATESGNFEHGANVLEGWGSRPVSLREIRSRLLSARSHRVRPGLDDKRLTAWNALAVSALADAGAALERPDFTQAARACAEFVLAELRDDKGRLLRTWKQGRGRLLGYLEDHAFLLEALITLYESTGEVVWYGEAVQLAEAMIERFADPDRGGFFTTASDHEQLPVRRKDMEDSPIPAGSSSAALGLLRLSHLSGESRFAEYGEGVLRLNAKLAVRYPGAFGHLLQAADFFLGTVREVAIVGERRELAELTAIFRARHRPRTVLAHGEPTDQVPLMLGRHPVGGKPAAYICEHFACLAPLTEPEDLRAALDG